MSKHYKMLLGGSPCTHWSIAQKNNRETEPEGLGWELFRNYLIAKEKFKPDYYLYENNKSMAKPIRNQIDIEFNRTYAENMNWELISSVEEDKGHTKRWLWRNKTTGKTEYITRILINSALVSAQNRQRYYWTNIPDVQQPADRGILLKDILESGTERIPPYGNNTKSRPVEALYANHAGTGEGSLEQRLCSNNPNKQQVDLIAEPIRIGDIGSNSQAHRVYSADGKSVTINAGGGGQSGKTGLYATPIKVGEISGGGQGNRIYSVDGKAVAQTSQGGGHGSKTGLYAVPIKYLNDKNMEHLMRPYGSKGKILHRDIEKAPTLMSAMGTGGGNGIYIAENWDGKTYPVYEVKNGLITIKDKQYPIKLPDGLYIIRKLTVAECRRLQTIPEWYLMPCSNSQNYKMLGNGWTVEVIKHILSHIPNISDCTVEVLSMYDGMSCGQIMLKELGCKINKYVSYEIDKYAIQTTKANFPNTEQRGDAFQVRQENWKY